MRPPWLTVVAVTISICCVAASSSRDKTTDLVQRDFDAWNAHDAHKVASLYTDHVVYEDVAFGLQAHGHAAESVRSARIFSRVPHPSRFSKGGLVIFRPAFIRVSPGQTTKKAPLSRAGPGFR